jgi:hypothetical protein
LAELLSSIFQSRSDDTLLTAGFSLRKNCYIQLKSPAGTTLKVSSLRDFATTLSACRRLKPAVNKV